MCGRYALYGPQSRWRQHFGVQDEFDFPPRFNIAPSQSLPVIRQLADGTRRIVMARWGLLPSWVKNPGELNQPINAKAETAAIKPMFRQAFRKSRVLVPADCFYEWKAEGRQKQPYLFRMKDETPFGIAGLLEHWRGPDGPLATFAILTTEPNAIAARIHNRMPAIVQPDDYAAWLNPDITEAEPLLKMLQPFPERLMEGRPGILRNSSFAVQSTDL